MNAVARFETLTRLGFAARGLLYLTVGYLAIEAGRATGTSGALRSLAEGGIGRVALAVIALGLLAYGTWRLAEAIVDIEGHGSDTKGRLVRAGHALSGIAHLLLAVLAVRLALGSAGESSGGGATGTTSWVLALPGGTVLVRLIGIGLLLAGLAQIAQAVRLRFLRQLDAQAARQEWVKWTGRLGYIARGAVFVLVGIFFWRAGASANAQEAGGMGEALASLPGWWQTAVAAGLALFGIFSIVQAIYRRITDPHVVERLKARVA